jgi:hypothetical protein
MTGARPQKTLRETAHEIRKKPEVALVPIIVPGGSGASLSFAW